MDRPLEDLMDICGFKKASDSSIYKPWTHYIAETAQYASHGAHRRKTLDAIVLGLHTLFIEFLAGRLPETKDEIEDGAVYMSRAAMEFRDRFIAATCGDDDD